MIKMAEEDSLDAISKHPEVKARLDEGVRSGLKRHAWIDCAIGAVERTVEELAGALPDDLKEMYGRLTEDPKYKRHFMENGSGEPLGSKNDANKSIKGY